MESYLRHNQNAWDKQVEKKNKWTIPVSLEEIKQARQGNWKVVLTPWIPVPVDWFPEMKNCDVLCLASAGGQQAPIFAAAGANVTVFDLSEKQLDQDKMVAARDNLQIKTIHGNMTDLSVFHDRQFDLIFHPVANCFIHDVNPVWRETYRVLKPGGLLLSGFANPILYLFDETEDDASQNLQITRSIPYSDLHSLSPQQKAEYKEKGYAFEFGHSLDDLIGGQIRAGFTITGFYEDRHHLKDHPLYKIIPTFIATKAIKKS